MARPLRRRLGRWAVVLLLILLGVGYVVTSRLRGPAVPVVSAARRPLVQRVVASGRVLPPSRIQLGSTLTTTVKAVRVDEGDRVKAGQLLVQLDDSAEQAALAQARGGVAQAQARLRQLRGVSSPVALESVRQAELTLRQSEDRYRRLQPLARRGAVSQADLDEATRAVELARSRQQAAAAQAAGTARAGSDSQIVLSGLEQARAAQDAAQARVDQARIVAPASAVVLLRQVEPGDIVQPGRVLLTLAREGETQLVFQPEEKNLGLLQLGQAALASADAFPEQRFAAVVSRIAPSVDAQRGTIEVRLRVPSPPPYLKPDMTVSVDVEVGRRAAALVIPAETIRDDPDGRLWVMVLQGGRAERRAVRLGLRGSGEVEVLEGLGQGEKVVLASAPVRAGQRARGTAWVQGQDAL